MDNFLCPSTGPTQEVADCVRIGIASLRLSGPDAAPSREDPLRTSRAAALALLAAFTLSACNGGDDPSEPVSTSTPSGTIETPSNTTPTVDPLTEAPKGETAQQFIRRWVALGNKMQETGETEAFLAVAGPDCRSCRDYASQIDEIYAKAGSIKTMGSNVVTAKHEGGDEWTVTLEGAPTTYVESKGAEEETLPGGRYELVLYIVEVDGTWIVGDYEDKK